MSIAERKTDIGPPHYSQFLPPVIKANYGKWTHHTIPEPGEPGSDRAHFNAPSDVVVADRLVPAAAQSYAGVAFVVATAVLMFLVIGRLLRASVPETPVCCAPPRRGSAPRRR